LATHEIFMPALSSTMTEGKIVEWLKKPGERVERGDLPRLALAGLTGVAMNQLLFFNGLNLTSPVNASLIMTVNPVLVLLISAALLGTEVTRRKVRAWRSA